MQLYQKIIRSNKKNMQNFYTQVKKIIDTHIVRKDFLKTKKDLSMLTKNDLIIQNKIIHLIKKYFPEINQFICEENFSLKNLKINFEKPFAVIDPIDGTENFFADTKMFGTLISINSHSKKIDLIYLPRYKMITRENIIKVFKKPKKNNIITLLSTKCLGKNYRGSQYRIYGSSAYSFYKFITGEVNEFVIVKELRHRIVLGLRLSTLINCKVEINNKNWMNKPKFQTEFKLRWI